MTTLIDSLVSKVKAESQAAESEYWGMVLDIAPGGTEPPANIVYAKLVAAGKTPEDFERDLDLAKRRLHDRTAIAKAERLEAEAPVVEDELDQLRERHVDAMKAIQPELADLDRREQELIEPVNAIRKRITELEEHPRQVDSAADRARQAKQNLVNSAPEWLRARTGDAGSRKQSQKGRGLAKTLLAAVAESPGNSFATRLNAD